MTRKSCAAPESVITVKPSGSCICAFRVTKACPKDSSILILNLEKHSQRNLYFQSSLSAGGNDEYSYGFLGDWETRRYFIGFGAQELKSNLRDYDKQFVQIGFAPYLGDYGDLHSWLMVKSKHDGRTDKWNTYPVIKFFKGDFLLEFGVDEEDEPDIHFMIRF